jgi:hypothetical protein
LIPTPIANNPSNMNKNFQIIKNKGNSASTSTIRGVGSIEQIQAESSEDDERIQRQY